MTCKIRKNKFASFKECIPYLFNLERAGIKYDLKNISTLLRYLGNPQEKFKSIHIAGTNGKGSVSSMINSVLIEKGFKTGLYTSPHLIDFRERILVNGKQVQAKFILDTVNILYKEIERIKPSFFEVTTAMAFEYFKKRRVDYAVVETGLGGRLDSTNILNPVLSVITSLSIDHIEFLGNEIGKITYEKGGIIKKNVPVVTGNITGESEKILRKIAKEKNAEILFSSKKNIIKINKRTEKGLFFDVNNKYKYKNLFIPLIGDYQVNNIKTFFTAIEQLNKFDNTKINSAEIKKGFLNIRTNSNFYGRFDILSLRPKIIADVSHNLQAIKNIRNNLSYFKYKNLVVIFAMMQDKNYRECLNEIGKLNAKIILTRPDYKRSAEPSELLRSVKRNRSRFFIAEDLSSAVRTASETAKKDDLVLITGSFFLVGEYLKLKDKFNWHINSKQ